MFSLCGMQTKVELTYVHVYGYLISEIKNFEQIRDTTLTLQGNDGRWARSRRLNREHYPPSSVQLGGTGGEKLSNFWNFVAIHESFLHKICGLASFDAAKRTIHESFLHENCIFYQFTTLKFSLLKVSRNTVWSVHNCNWHNNFQFCFQEISFDISG